LAATIQAQPRPGAATPTPTVYGRQALATVAAAATEIARPNASPPDPTVPPTLVLPGNVQATDEAPAFRIVGWQRLPVKPKKRQVRTMPPRLSPDIPKSGLTLRRTRSPRRRLLRRRWTSTGLPPILEVLRRGGPVLRAGADCGQLRPVCQGRRWSSGVRTGCVRVSRQARTLPATSPTLSAMQGQPGPVVVL
jgi:hypothetical protein